MLAPKTIHFCEDHIYVESEIGVIGEDSMGQDFGWTSCIQKSGIGRKRLMQEDGSGGARNYHDADDSSDAWQKICEIYSRCKLSHKTDKLFAINGLVQDRQKNGKFPYR